MIYRYVTILIAACCLLAGLQVPGFVTQYSIRTAAHLSEVRQNLAGFQAIADRYHGGSLDALVQKHRQSVEPTFRDEGDVIQDMVDRLHHFEAETQALSHGLVSSISHLALSGDRELMSETLTGYTFVITLDQDTLVCGGIALVLGVASSDLLYLLLRLPFRRRTAP